MATLTLLLLPDLIVWLKFGHGGVHSPLWAMLPLVISVTVIANTLLAAITCKRMTALRLSFLGLILGGIPKLVFGCCCLLLPWQIALVPAFLTLTALFYGFTAGWRRLKIRAVTCSFPELPQVFDGYRILHFSDLHAGTFARHPRFMERLADAVTRQKVDMIVFTGDLVNIKSREADFCQQALSRISRESATTCLAVMGNHDYCESDRVRAFERKIGWHLLQNEHILVRWGREQIAFVGVKNISKPPFPTYGNIEKAVEGIPSGTFQILLAHDPIVWEDIIRKPADHPCSFSLTLSGHTHGAQLRIGPFSPAAWIYKYWGGLYEEALHGVKRCLYVSLGIGGTVPFRLGAWPEITVLTLRHVKN